VQRVKGVPSLPVYNKNNRFSCLEVEEVLESDQQEECEVAPEEITIERKCKKEKWEKRLPRAFKIATTPSTKSLRLKVQLQATDTGEVHGVEGLLDCGADGEFLDTEFVRANNITTRALSQPIPVNNVDGTPNEHGPISEVATLVLRYKGHSERVVFAVTRLGKEDMILGLPWLRAHNPEVDWVTGEVKMSRCPEKCRRCFEEEQEERKEARRTERCIRACRMGPFPNPTVEEVPEEEDEELEEGCEEEDCIEDGDRVFMTTIRPEDDKNIRATGNFSQRLAEAFHRNEKVKSFHDAVPDYLHDFEDVFAEESYDALPERKQWDHAIELVPDAQARNWRAMLARH